MNRAYRLGRKLAKPSAGRPARQASAQVADVTETGVNLYYAGSLVTDVPCSAAYRGRRAGDWVAVRISAGQLMVLGKLGGSSAELSDDLSDTVDAVLGDERVASVDFGQDAAPSGFTQAESVWFADQADGTVRVYLKVGASDPDPPPPPPTRPNKPITIAPNGSGSWRGGHPDDYHPEPTQGSWTSRSYLRGGWFYGNKIANACAGQSVSGMKIRIRRLGGGWNAKRPIHAWLHDETGQPSGQLALNHGPETIGSVSVGGVVNVALPAAWVNLLAAGTAKGVAVYVTNRNDYSVYAKSSGQITITFGG
ncbi:MAG: hypothetical protein ACRDQA_12465 [Nocardioidaceae bacterium]